MNVTTVARDIFAELQGVAASSPRERLPKEEQVRCCVYARLKKGIFDVVCAERGYGDVDDNDRAECDIWAAARGRPELWMEIKTGWAGAHWNNKPSGQLASWQADIDKLRMAPKSSDRYFLLVGFFGFDPDLQTPAPGRSVVEKIHGFHSNALAHKKVRPFEWRKKPPVTHMGVWFWHWRPGRAISR